MNWLKILMGLGCIMLGVMLMVSIIGAIIGIPLIYVGARMIYREQRKYHKGLIKESMKELEEERKGRRKKE